MLLSYVFTVTSIPFKLRIRLNFMMLPLVCFGIIVVTNGQSNLTKGCIATGHGQFNPIC